MKLHVLISCTFSFQPLAFFHAFEQSWGWRKHVCSANFILRAMRFLPKTLRSIGNVLNKWQACVWCVFRLSYGRWKRYVLPMLRGAEHEKISIRSFTFHTNNTNSNLRPEQGDKSHAFKFSPVPPSINICPWHNPQWQTVFIIMVSQHTAMKNGGTKHVTLHTVDDLQFIPCMLAEQDRFRAHLSCVEDWLVNVPTADHTLALYNEAMSME